MDILCSNILDMNDVCTLQQSMMSCARRYLVGLTHRFAEPRREPHAARPY